MFNCLGKIQSCHHRALNQGPIFLLNTQLLVLGHFSRQIRKVKEIIIRNLDMQNDGGAGDEGNFHVKINLNKMSISVCFK